MDRKYVSATLISFCFIVLFTSACTYNNQEHFITDAGYRKQVEQDFEKVRVLAENRGQQLFDVFNKDLTLEEKEALKFLYAYMPLNDLTNSTGGFYLKNVKLAFAARDSFPWGKDIPEDIFRHFVLPHRINNEDTDTARAVFFRELLPRVKHLDIETAALEINHWCHEKVSYQPTNIRTMAPLGVIKTAYGRCGEESTFTTTALRAAGIPARQVYTPRWAHVDDNHAWVEVFVNGTWKYLGACEPEPELNIGWFDAPVLRAMMVHTKAFGKYKGDEHVLGQHNKYSMLNLLSNYVPVKEVVVKAVDKNNHALENVYVEFGLYNYAEYYPLKSTITEAGGLASITTGYGDIRVFASDGKGNFDIRKITVEKEDTVTIQLGKKAGQAYSVSWENTPPVTKVAPPVESEKAEANKIRFQYEDSVRNNYINTFYTEEKAKELAVKLNLDPKHLWAIMAEARGNYPAIEEYFLGAKNVDSPYALKLLKVIEGKDLHDATAAVLLDHLGNVQVKVGYPTEMLEKYILNPRIKNEQLTAYRAFLKEQFSTMVNDDPGKTAKAVTEWINKNISIDNEWNYYKTALSPKGLYELKVSDEQSRDMFFVAVLRSLGIPARIEQTTLVPQYFNGEWVTVSFDGKGQFVTPKGFITIKNKEGQVDTPQYRIHFGLAKFDGQRFTTLDYGWGRKLSEFPENMEIEPGYYQLTTGNRLPDGTVLVNQSYFTIEEGKASEVELVVNQDQRPLEVLANWDTAPKDENYTIVGWIDPDTEPGNHFINDLKTAESTFASNTLAITFYCGNQKQLGKLKERVSIQFSSQIDKEWQLLKDFYNNTGISSEANLPVFVVIGPEGNVYFHAAGYNIGTPEQLLKIMGRL